MGVLMIMSTVVARNVMMIVGVTMSVPMMVMVGRAAAGAGTHVLAERAIGRRSDPLHMMVMALLGEPHFRLEAEHLFAIFAHLAIHHIGAFDDLEEPLDEGFDHEVMGAEIGRLEKTDVRMGGRDHIRLVVDAAHENAGEEEIGKDDDALITKARGMAQPRLDQREGDARIDRLAPAEAEPFPEHAHDLGDVGIGVGVGGAAPDDDEHRVVERLALSPAIGLETLADALAGRPDHLRIDAELAAIANGEIVLGGIGVEDGGNVVLGVAGGKQHARQRHDVPRTLAPQLVEAGADDGLGKFQIAMLGAPIGQARLQLFGKAAKFLHRRLVAAAMAAEHQGFERFGM